MPFTNVVWNADEVSANLSPEDYCKVCLFDLNPEGAEKTKNRCKGPMRATPKGPFNTRALVALVARFFTIKGVPRTERVKGAKRLVRLCGEAGINVRSRSLLKLAGVEPKKG